MRQTLKLYLTLGFLTFGAAFINEVQAQQIYVPNPGTHLGMTSGSGPDNVGIGTSTPQYRLDIDGAVNTSEYRLNGSPIGIWRLNGSDVIRSNGKVGIGDWFSSILPEAKLHVQADCEDVGFRLESICPPNAWIGYPQNLFEIVTQGFNNTRRFPLAIDVGGKLGIGTNDPQADLDVVGNIRLNGDDATPGDILIADENGRVVWERPDIALNSNCALTEISNLPSQFQTICHSEALAMGSNGLSRLYVGGSASGVPLAWNAYPGTFGNSGMFFHNSRQAARFNYDGFNGKMSLDMSTNDSRSQGVNVNWEKALVVHNPTANNNSMVGIGTSTYNSEYRLMVNGAIRAKEIVVESGWADFVFDDDYELRSLAEVEEFIITNGHLPDVPSAAEVEEKGLRVAEMNTTLMQKVEELTLYVIQQQKEIDALRAQR